MYLYILKRDDFSAVPETLIKLFGKADFSMMINLAKREHLARVDIEKVRRQLLDEGYYLQMPPFIPVSHESSQ